MVRRVLAPVPLIVFLVIVGVMAGATPVPGQEGGPALSVPEARLEEALVCPGPGGGAGEPVLLVHGTFVTPEENWSWNYARALPALGLDVCTVELPGRALGDIQLAAEYVVHAVRTMAGRFGRPVDVVGISQGGLEPRWALRWWPDVRAAVDDLVTLVSPHHGTVQADVGCALPCPAAIWQMRPGSRFLAALNSGDETPGAVSYTSVFTLTDELVQPQLPGRETSALAGAVNLTVQDLCPGRVVLHGQSVADATTYAVVLDAITQPGPADRGRLDPRCTETSMPGVDRRGEFRSGASILFQGGPAILAHPRTDREPDLAPYAR